MATDHEHLYRRWLDEVWNTGSVADDLIGPDFVGHWPGRDIRGTAELIEIIDETRSMLSDLRFSIEIPPLGSSDLVAARWSGRGTTDDGGIAAFTGNDILRVEDGLVVEYWTGTSAG